MSAGAAAPTSSVAVVGAGVAGSTAAILLAQAGHRVDLVDVRDTPAAGAGIMLQFNALRVLRRAGVLDAVLRAGYGFDSTAIRRPDRDATLVAELTEGRADPDLPATAGIARPELARLLLERAGAVGVRVLLGHEARLARNGPSGAELDLTWRGGSSTTAYDLVVAADGVGSRLRAAVGVEVAARPLPLGVWRVFLPRPRTVTRTEVINGGTAYFAGFAPCGPGTMYAWLVDDFEDRRHLPQAQQLEVVRRLSAGYGGPWEVIRPLLRNDVPISYTRYSELLVPPPWHRGRVLLIGDAVHACPPTMAQGAAMALKDAAVLAELLADPAAAVTDDLLDAFAVRRTPRVEAVVHGSVQLAQWQLRHEHRDVAGLVRATMTALGQPA